jgi:dipeptide/tripeptide permease
MKKPKDQATEYATLFQSVNYLTPLIGAWLADRYLGRYLTILWFCVIYVLGVAW